MQVNWNKGTALNHLLEVLGLRGSPDVVAIYVGDDHTDEDAFKALNEGEQGKGGAGAVGRAARPCAIREVRSLLASQSRHFFTRKSIP
jgi:trehalose-phosphatase